MKTRIKNIIDRTINGQVPRPKKLLIDIISEKPKPEPEQVYRVRVSSGFVLRGRT